MRVYRERLGVPIWWWLVTGVCVLLLGTTLWAGLSIAIAITTYVILGGLSAGMLLVWGAAVIEVTDSELRAGSQRLALARISDAAAMDAAQTRALRGPHADPAAYLLVRPYLLESVYVEIADRPASRPYWLLASRRPADLAAAIERARSRAARQAPCDDDGPVDHAAAIGPAEPADAVHPGKDPNAW